MAELLLKDTQIKKAVAKETIYYLNDGGGLRLKISPNGSKIWVYRFTFGGKAKETTFQSGVVRFVWLSTIRTNNFKYY